MTPGKDMRDFFAVAAPGLEPMVAEELRALGEQPVPEDGGVSWQGNDESLYRALLHLRLASRVLVRLGSFGARGFAELERQARRLDWQRHVEPGMPVLLRVTARKSRLYHEGAIAERLLGVIGAAAGSSVIRSVDDERIDAAGAQMFVVRFLRDRCTISADAAGALLHLRGYRQQVARAPLRETLAAALLHAVTPHDVPLLDPLCGSGTIPIEAALRARRIPPGLATAAREPREFRFEHWPDFDARLWQGVVDDARADILTTAPAPVFGSDRDAGAVAAARANAARAGVLDDIILDQLPLGDARIPPGTGVLLTNPPYGVRVGERAGLRDLYAALGNLARRRLRGWRVGLLCADARLCAQLRLPLHSALTTRNGGIPVELLVGTIAADSASTG